MSASVNPAGASELRDWASREQLAEVLATSPRVIDAWLSGRDVSRNALPPRRVRRVREFAREHAVDDLLADVSGEPRYRLVMRADHGR